MDVRVGSRHQWVNFEGAPRTYFMSASGSLKLGETNGNKYNSLRVSNLNPYKQKNIKIGVGGHVFDDRSGALQQFEAMASGAVHVPVSQNTYLSLGLATGINSFNLDLSDVAVLNPSTDQTYQSYLSDGSSKTRFRLTTGLAAYSDRFYVSYAMMNTMMESGILEAGASKVIHHVLGGVVLNAGSSFEIIPNAYIRHIRDIPSILDVGVRVRYRQNPYIGISLRNNKALIMMLGMSYKDKVTIGYSYESHFSDVDTNLSGSHELFLGFRFFNHGKFIPMW